MQRNVFRIGVICIFLLPLFASDLPAEPEVKVTSGRQLAENSWHAYSMGLHYKAEKDYSRAIQFFKKAASRKEELYRVYFQIAGCYFHLLNFEKANYYSRLSINQNKSFTKPYLLTYNTFLRLKNYKKASESLESLLKIKPDNVRVRYSLANLYYNNLKKLDKAYRHYNRIISLSKNRAVDNFYKEYSHYYLGYIYYRKGLVRSSINHFEKAVEINQNNNSALYTLILLLMDQYRIDDALRFIPLYVRRFPHNAKINSILGRIYYLRDSLKSLRHLRKAAPAITRDGLVAKALLLDIEEKDAKLETALQFIIKKFPKYISPHIALGNVYTRKKNKKGALTEYFTAGILLYNVKLFNEAKRLFLRTLTIKDSIPEVYTYLGRIYEEKNMKKMAILNYTKSNELKENTAVLVHLGYLYSQKNDFRNAVRYFDRAIRIDPQNPRTYFFKGLSYSYEKKYPLAEKYMKKAITLQKSDLYYFYLSTVLEKFNKIHDTIESLKMAIKLNPRSSRAYNYLGYLYADRNINLDQSIMLVKKALSFEPDNGAYLDSLGWVYYRKGEYEPALRNLLLAETQLEKSGTPDPVVFDHIGDTFRKMNRIRDAIIYWEKSLKLKNVPAIKNKIRIHRKKLLR